MALPGEWGEFPAGAKQALAYTLPPLSVCPPKVLPCPSLSLNSPEVDMGRQASYWAQDL